MYNSIRPGSKTVDPVVTDIRDIKYKSGNISVKIKSFDNDFFDLPQRKRRNEVASLSEFQQSSSSVENYSYKVEPPLRSQSSYTLRLPSFLRLSSLRMN